MIDLGNYYECEICGATYCELPDITEGVSIKTGIDPVTGKSVLRVLPKPRRKRIGKQTERLPLK